MAPLPAGDVEDARAGGKLEELEQPRHLVPVTLQGEERLVLEEVLIVEVAAPPLGGLLQKKTGSR